MIACSLQRESLTRLLPSSYCIDYDTVLLAPKTAGICDWGRTCTVTYDSIVLASVRLGKGANREGCQPVLHGTTAESA